MKNALLQICPLMPQLEQDLAALFDVHRLFEIENRTEWLARHGACIRAVATGSHAGIDRQLMDTLPQLEIVAINGVGFEKVDVQYARSRGVRVSFTPDVLTDDVADLAVGLVIDVLRGVSASDRHVRAGQWAAGDRPLTHKVTGCVFGIAGLGRIGRAIADRLSVFGEVCYYGRAQKEAPYRHVAGLADLARSCDVLILAASANEQSRHMVGTTVLDALGPDGYLVNIARGSLIDEDALIAALAEKRIAGAALDVFASEPHIPARLLELPNVVLTPHIGSATADTRRAMGRLVISNLKAHFGGQPLPSAVV